MTVKESERASIEQVMESNYIRRITAELGEADKELTMTRQSSTSTQSCNHTSILPELSYDSAVALINYCRLVDKIIKLTQSLIFSKHILWWSLGLVEANINMQNVLPEKQANLRWIIKDYYEKYLAEYKESPVK